jgi:CheY-like chemotaxis protein
MKILIAEDEPDICSLYRIALEDRNHQVLIAEDGENCLKLYAAEARNGLGVQKPTLDSINAKRDVNKKNEWNHDSVSPSYNYDDAQSRHPPFDAVVLDYRMPKKDGLEVAKEILKLYPKQRIIFASAYIKESLEDCVKELDQIVELMQKPFEPDVLVDAIEDREISGGLEELMINFRMIKEQNSEPTLDQMRNILEGLRKIQKGRTF